MKTRSTTVQKGCTICKSVKPLTEFYRCLNGARGYVFKSECKECTIQRNSSSEKKSHYTKKRSGDPKYQEYQREYYRKNIEKFRKYRNEFKLRHPEYHKHRYAKRQEEKQLVKQALRENDIS